MSCWGEYLESTKGWDGQIARSLRRQLASTSRQPSLCLNTTCEKALLWPRYAFFSYHTQLGTLLRCEQGALIFVSHREIHLEKPWKKRVAKHIGSTRTGEVIESVISSAISPMVQYLQTISNASASVLLEITFRRLSDLSRLLLGTMHLPFPVVLGRDMKAAPMRVPRRPWSHSLSRDAITTYTPI